MNGSDSATVDQQIARFLDEEVYAVAGASTNRAKYGNKVVRVYQQTGRTVYPINPRAEEIEGLTAYANLASLPERPHGLSIVTPPKITEQVVAEAIELGVGHIWMQPGAESDAAIELGREAGLNVIAGGPCILVTLGYREK